MFKGHRFRTTAMAILVLGSVQLVALSQPIAGGGDRAVRKIHPTLYRRAAGVAGTEPIKAWILFTDKAVGAPRVYRAALDRLAKNYNARAVRRRRARRTAEGLFDEHDLPVVQRYVDAVTSMGVSVHVTSKWLNAVSAVATMDRFERIAELPFVKKIQPVRRGRKVEPIRVEPANNDFFLAPRRAAGDLLDHGLSTTQLNQIGVIELHNQGFTGAGVVIGILDTGFIRTHDAFNQPDHPLQVIAEFDFINNDTNAGLEPGDPGNQPLHGTYILGTLGAYLPGQYIGGAFDASFILCKTEDVTGEYMGEEDNYVAGLEFIEANGGDLATASLGYIDWYTQADLDGLTAVTTQAVNIATANGLICLNAAGNSGHDANPSTSALIAPADALKVITCGAASSNGAIASFSSDGPTADGRVKPEVLALGVSTQTVSPGNDTTYVPVSGTSLSTPLVAGAVACLVQAHPDWTVDRMRAQLFHTADYFVTNGTFDPNFVRGYGLVDAAAANALKDCNGNGIDDATDIAVGTSADRDANGVPDECQTGACCRCGGPTGCRQTDFEQCSQEGGSFSEGAICTTITCPDQAPMNDLCSQAVVVSDGITPFDSRCAADDGPITMIGQCQFTPPDFLGGDIWFHYTATCDGLLNVQLVNTSFEGYVDVHCDGGGVCTCPIDSGSEYACGKMGIGLAEDVPVSTGNCYTIRVGGLNGAGGTGLLEISCITPTLPPPQFLQPGPTTVATNRFVTLQLDSEQIVQALRFDFVSLPPPFDVHNGRSMWVGPPRAVSENSAVVDPQAAPGFGVLQTAELQCDPFYRDWSTVGTVHVHHPLIVPDGQYRVQGDPWICRLMSQPTSCFRGVETCGCYCSCPGDGCFPVPFGTSASGDIVGDCTTIPCTPPDGRVDVTTDVTAILDKFKNLATAPAKSRADLEPSRVDLKINIADATLALDAFRNMAYPFADPGLFPCGP